MPRVGSRFPTITYTKINRFESCRKWYWFQYLSGRELPPEKERTPANVVGNGVHGALRKLCLTGDPDDARADLDAYLRMPLHECAGPGTEAHEEAFVFLERGIEAHASIDSANRWAELKCEAESRRHQVRAWAAIDRVDQLRDGSWQLIDWKTGRWDEGEKTDQQLDIYHVIARTARRIHKTETVTTIGWNLRTNTQRVRVLTRDDAVATLNYLGGIARRLRELTEFEANPGGQCGFCPWREQCPDAAAGAPTIESWLDDEEDDDGLVAEAAIEG
jgi:RecB family exonuclease